MFFDGGDIDKNLFENALKSRREVCLKHRKEDFRVRLKILLGDDFFRDVLVAGFMN
ncbi:MAG: hypothetical protein QXQ90_09890 [Desulfurococcaceae archaeon]